MCHICFFITNVFGCCGFDNFIVVFVVRYDTTLYTFAGLMTLSALSNSLIQEPLKNQIGSGANFSPHVPLPEKVRRNGDAATSAGGKQFTDRRKKKK